MGEPYNFVILNYYENGKSKLGAHSDDTRDLVPGTSIASVSIGAERPFVLTPRHTSGSGGAEVRMMLASGSLAVMAGNTQSAYKHEVPASAAVGWRINMTFRCVKV